MPGASEVATRFKNEHQRRVRASEALFRSYAAEIGNVLRSGAPWIDRTGNARNSLEAVTEFAEEAMVLVARGGGPPDYVRWLETAMAGRYAILRPTMELYAGRIYQDLVRIWS